MNTTILSSSVVQKAVIALSGLLLSAFVLLHWAGNLLLLDAPGRYNQLAQELQAWGWLFHGLEFTLLLAFIVHIWLTIAIRRQQKKCAPPYTHWRRKKAWAGSWTVNLTSRWMVVSGPLILGFLIIHLQQFRLQPGDRNLEALVAQLFHNPAWVAVYELALLPLGWHLAHGLGSSLQSLGLGHESITPWLPRWSQMLSAILVLGYAIIPLAIYAHSR